MRMKEIIEELKGQEYEDAISKFSDEDEDEGFNLDDFLGGLGIGPSK